MGAGNGKQWNKSLISVCRRKLKKTKESLAIQDQFNKILLLFLADFLSATLNCFTFLCVRYYLYLGRLIKNVCSIEKYQKNCFFDELDQRRNGKKIIKKFCLQKEGKRISLGSGTLWL